MKLGVLKESFSVCKVASYECVDLEAPFVFTGSTDAEKSLVCPTSRVPAATLAREDGWRAFRVEGQLDFSLVGILARISSVLAAALVFIPTCFIFWEVREHSNIVENGLVEFVQLALLLCSSAVYAFRARAARGGRGPSRAFALCALFILAMCIRELDGFFDKLTGDHRFWFYIVMALVLASACIFFQRFSRSVHDLAQFFVGPEMPLLASGVLVCIVFAQIIGYKGVWSDVFSLPIWQTAVEQNIFDGKFPDSLDIQRHVKNIVEESTEICGYLLILFSAILSPALGLRYPRQT